MNYTDRQGTRGQTQKHRETGKKERKKEKNGDWNTSTSNSWNIFSKSHHVRHKISEMT